MSDPGFTVRGRFCGQMVQAHWQGGELVEAPDMLRAEVGRVVATRRWIERDPAQPWLEAGEATMTDRWLAQATLLAIFEPDSIELEDPILETKTES